MKEYLFKSKRIDTNEWVEGYYWTNGLCNHFIRVTYNENNKSGRKPFLCKDYEIIPETVGQYSNLKDNNKKETFENDIIQCRFYNEDMDTQNVENLIIIFSRENNQWILENMDGDHVDDFDKEFEENIEFYLIGNKFDNPELLENKYKEN